MKTQIQNLIVSVQTQGLLALKQNDPGILIHMVLYVFQKPFAVPDPIGPEYIGMNVEENVSFSKDPGIHGICLITQSVQYMGKRGEAPF